MIATCFNFASNITKMQKVYLLSVLKKNGFLVYKCEGSNDMIIRKKSDYANGKALEKYINGTIKLKPQTEKIKSIINRMNILIPNERDWHSLSEDIMKYGLYNAYQLAVAPNQSSAYIMEVSPSVAPVSSEVEFRDYGYLY